MRSSLVERSGFEPWPEILCCVLVETNYPHSASLHLSAGELNPGGNPAMDYHSIQRGIEILLVASCSVWKPELALRSDGLLGSPVWRLKGGDP